MKISKLSHDDDHIFANCNNWRRKALKITSDPECKNADLIYKYY